MNVSLSPFGGGIRALLRIEGSLPDLSFVYFKLESSDGVLCYFAEKEINSDCTEVEFEVEQVSSGQYCAFVEIYSENGRCLKINSKALSVKSPKLEKVDELLKLLLENPQLSTFKNLVARYPSALKYSFLKLRSLFHSGSPSAKRKKLIDFSEVLLPSGEGESIVLLNLPSQHLFLSTLLVYGGDSRWLSINHKKITATLSRNKFPDPDYYFILGLMSYKLGDYSAAANHFDRILPYKDNAALLSHQLSAINYKHPVYPDYKEKPQVRDFNTLRTPCFESEGVALISCDWGFFSAYQPLAQSKADKYGIQIHYHLVLPEGFNVEGLENEYLGEFGLSYEVEPINTRAKSKHYKTYYSLVRYLVAKEVSKIYNQKLLISDIDIDYNNPISEIFSAVQDDEAALVFSNTGLPWASIMAGFNVFGKDFFTTDFYRILCDFMLFNYREGLDFWMLDQVALEVAYQNSSRETVSKIKSMNALKSFRVSQQADNSKIKQEARLNIIKAISEIGG